MNTEEILGAWFAAAMTLFILSFLYKDNPFYRLAEHIFIGITVGISIVQAIWKVLIPDWWLPMIKGDWILLIPGIFGLLALTRLIPRLAWLSRWTFAFVMGYAAGLAIPSAVNAFILPHVESTISPIVPRALTTSQQSAVDSQVEAFVRQIAAADRTSEQGRKSLEGARDGMEKLGPGAIPKIDELMTKQQDPAIKEILAGIRRDIVAASVWNGVGDLLVLIIVVGVLIYFFFSIEHKGVFGVAARGGIIFLMAAFGIAYGNTVMGRMSLLYGRFYDLKQFGEPKYYFATPVLLVATIVGLVVWEMYSRRKRTPEA